MTLDFAGNPCPGGRLSTVDLLVMKACFAKEEIHF